MLSGFVKRGHFTLSWSNHLLLRLYVLAPLDCKHIVLLLVREFGGIAKHCILDKQILDVNLTGLCDLKSLFARVQSTLVARSSWSPLFYTLCAYSNSRPPFAECNDPGGTRCVCAALTLRVRKVSPNALTLD